ncbi:MAG TPA: Hsp20/alpha crystallin family protein [Usitatibacter sp.]|nr:Hsp20/alpha crystallin family protein [Usitatibacter sp.]
MYPSLTRFPGGLFSDFDMLQRQVERLVGARAWPSSIRAAGRGAFPAINMGVTADAVEVYAFAPGLDPASIDVSIDKGLLVISGERASELPEESEKVSVYAAERCSGAFRRAISLPDDVDATGVKATYNDGVLRIAIPKRESAKPRRIEIR